MSRSSARLLVVLCAAGILLCAPVVARGAVNLTQKGVLSSLASPVNDVVEYPVGSAAEMHRYTVRLESGSTISLGLGASSGGGTLTLIDPGLASAGQCSAAVGVPGAISGYVASVTGTYTLDIDPTYLMSLPGPSQKYWFAYTLSWTIDGPETYETVTFDGNGGTLASASATTTTNTALGARMPASPTRTGFTFAGWNTAANGSGTAFAIATLVPTDVTVYAQWTPAYVGPVATSITIRTTATSTYIGRTPVLTGSVTPYGMIGVNIVVYVKKPGKAYWSYSSNRTVYALNGGAAWLYKYYFKRGMTKGTYYFKASAPAPSFASSAGFARSESSVISIRLK
jgi:uncharacterized repeat protein (TIGR02543 family)